jgi:hypothetical protein
MTNAHTAETKEQGKSPEAAVGERLAEPFLEVPFRLNGTLHLGGRSAGIRTLDPLIKSQLLYQLSYASTEKEHRSCLIWSERRDSNPRQPPWQGGALPLSYTRSTRKQTLIYGYKAMGQHFFFPASSQLTKKTAVLACLSTIRVLSVIVTRIFLLSESAYDRTIQYSIPK